jgi:Bacterial RNA polymerase, alpha chain C terminal domain
MILDILTALFFVGGFVLILMLISERRRDVLHGPYLAKERSDRGSEITATMYDPDPNFPDDTLIEIVRFPTVLRNSLMSSGLKTIGEVRATSDADLLRIPDLGNESVRYLRKMVGPTNE